MRTLRVLFVVGLVGGLAACYPVAVGGPGPVVPGNEPGTRLPRPNTAGAGTGASSTMRYVCRGNVPSGWIAIDYIDDPEGCATSKARSAVAVIVPLSVTKVGGTLEVCADERIPSTWVEVQPIMGDGRCPPNRPRADVGKPTVREIRRVR